MKRLLHLAAIALALGGCASTPGGMRDDPSVKRVVVLDLGYQTVLKRLVDWWGECGGSSMLPIGQLINDVQHYPDLRQATIVRGATGVGTQIHGVIDLREVGAGKTEMTTYYKIRPDANAAQQRKAAEGSRSCE